VAVVNYPNDHDYTRVTEFKQLTGQEHSKTGVVYEYPRAEGDPYYPIPKPECNALYKRYQELAEATPGVWFVGRLATYKYYNMDQVVAQALATFEKILGRRAAERPAVVAESPARVPLTSRYPTTPVPAPAVLAAAKNGNGRNGSDSTYAGATVAMLNADDDDDE